MTNQWLAGGAAGIWLLLGNLALFPGLIMFWLRNGHRGGTPPNRAYFVGERGFIMAAIPLTAIGFMALGGQLDGSNGGNLARTGAMVYLVAGILGLVVEALGLTNQPWNRYHLLELYVVLAFLAQAAIGVALVQSGALTTWIGWATILWNIAWLVILPLITPRDIYFPILHHVMPLVIGIALLWQVL